MTQNMNIMVNYDPTADYSEEQPQAFWTGYNPFLEDANEIRVEGHKAYLEWRDNFPTNIEWPDEIDPRPWYDVWNQGGQGSCQGMALADNIEYSYYLEHGRIVNPSRAFCYLASQEFGGGIGGDRGSTLSGGTKAARRGIPSEDKMPYTDSYRTNVSRYRSIKDEVLRDDANLFKLEGAITLSSEEDCHRFLRSRSGSIQIGIGWSLPNAWEITSYRGGGGGHSVVIVGLLKMQSWGGYGYLLKNSWGQRWGRDGWALIHPRAIKQMLTGRWSTFVGRSTARVPHVGPHVPDL